MCDSLTFEEQQKLDSFHALLLKMPEYHAYLSSMDAFGRENARYFGVDYPNFDESFSVAQRAYCKAMIALSLTLSRLPEADQSQFSHSLIRSLKGRVQDQIDLVTQ